MVGQGEVAALPFRGRGAADLAEHGVAGELVVAQAVEVLLDERQQPQARVFLVDRRGI
jgi:hypothetical protein